MTKEWKAQVTVRLEGFVFFPTVLLSIFTLLILSASSVSLFYFILAVPMCKCLGKDLCMSSIFLIAILNGTCIFAL